MCIGDSGADCGNRDRERAAGGHPGRGGGLRGERYPPAGARPLPHPTQAGTAHVHPPGGWLVSGPTLSSCAAVGGTPAVRQNVNVDANMRRLMCVCASQELFDMGCAMGQHGVRAGQPPLTCSFEGLRQVRLAVPLLYHGDIVLL
eukprot:898202-Prorocentrum_minimum.AAC.2